MENLNQTQPQTQIGGQPATAATPVAPPMAPSGTSTGAAPTIPSASGELASVGLRLVAIVIDGFLIGIINFGLTFLFAVLLAGSDTAGLLFSFLPMLVTWSYLVTMDVKFGATLGKKALGLRVQNMSTGENLTWLEAILRETVGRFVSALVLGLGYFWVLWDKDKQGWHDKIAKSVVVKA